MKHSKLIFRILAVLAPILVFLLVAIPGTFIIVKIENKALIFLVLFLMTFGGGFAIFKTTKWFAQKTNANSPRIGNLKSLFIGVTLGVCVSLLSGSLYALTHHLEISPNVNANLLKRTLASISSPILEEVAFRGGVVELVTSYAGSAWGLAAGSIPFGLMHLLNFFFGGPVSFAHTIGVSVAGLLLSLVYLRWGLLASIGLHYMWNSFAGAWVQALNLPAKEGTQILEGDWTTITVLSALSLLLLWMNGRDSIRPS